jgi:thioredoxin reductase (NADPH)
MSLKAGLEESPDRDGAYPRLEDDLRAELLALGKLRSTEAGEVLFREGDPGYDLFVIESGTVAVVAGHGGENRIVALHGRHRFVGELGLLRDANAYLSAVVYEGGAVIQVPAAKVRELVEGGGKLGGLILASLLARREILIEAEAGVRLIGSRYSPQTRALREFLARNRIPARWSDPEDDPIAEGLLATLEVDAADTPVVIAAGRLLRRPSSAELARALGLGAVRESASVCDLLVVGAGPAGLAAAVYGASEGLATQLLDAVAVGGQASTSSRIENYLGFPNGISGGELAERAFLQAEKFGARVSVPCIAAALERGRDRFCVHLDDGDTAMARTVIVATGARYRRLDLPELDRYEGLGVFYAATESEARLCEEMPVIVVGGGNSAGQAAIFLSERASTCRLLIRGDDLGHSMSNYLVEEIEARPGVEVMLHTEVSGLEGERSLEAVAVRDGRTGATTSLDAQALFVFIGADPHTEWLGGQVAADPKGFLLTGEDLHAANPDRPAPTPLFLETSEPGVFAVGDVRAGSIKRVAAAAGEGSMAVRMVHQRLAAL